MSKAPGPTSGQKTSPAKMHCKPPSSSLPSFTSAATFSQRKPIRTANSKTPGAPSSTPWITTRTARAATAPTATSSNSKNTAVTPPNASATTPPGNSPPTSLSPTPLPFPSSFSTPCPGGAPALFTPVPSSSAFPAPATPQASLKKASASSTTAAKPFPTCNSPVTKDSHSPWKSPSMPTPFPPPATAPGISLQDTIRSTTPPPLPSHSTTRPGTPTPPKTLSITSDRTIQLGPRRPLGHDQYQTRHFRVLLDRATGELSIYDLTTGTEKLLLDRMTLAGVEERRGNYIFAMPASGRTAPALFDSVETIDNNALWHRLRLRGTVYGMRFTQTLTLFNHVAEIHLENEIDWTEPRWVRLQQLFPYAASGNTIRYGVPYGQVTYPDVMSASLGKGGDEIDPTDRDKLRLCRHWVDIGDDTSGVTIGCDHRMWEFEKPGEETESSTKLLRAYMLRGVGYCFGAARDTEGKLQNISRPPPGRYTFRYVIRPRATSFADSTNWRCGWELNCPPHAVTLGGTKPQNNATLPATDSLFDFTDTTLVTTAFKKAEDTDAVILRAFETAGRSAPALPPINIGCHTVSETNILEEIQSAPTPVRPWEIKTIICKPKM
ncbi:hypothetical protein Ga0100230_001985 [Opitutaceae bacterium TAV3]|nr:hypothetical protein Ga0100230_001985 [Opitutaceae bacterium TAV3]